MEVAKEDAGAMSMVQIEPSRRLVISCWYTVNTGGTARDR